MVPTRPAEMEPRHNVGPLLPKAPTTQEDLDIPILLAEDLILRMLYTKGTSSLLELSSTLKLSLPLVHSLFQDLRQKQLFEVTGMEGNDYVFRLSGIGRDLAAKRFLISHYAGPAPVSLAAYSKVVRDQAVNPISRSEDIERSAFRPGFNHEVPG
jgi:hypothetical protein